MSLLLQALQKAAKNREAGTAPVEEPPPPAAPPMLEPPAAVLPPTFILEAKQQSSAPEPELALAEEDLFEADEPLPTEPNQRFEPFGASPSPSPANAASILRASETPSAGWIDFLRDRPVWALGIGAGIFLVFYAAYVYLQIAHPGILRGEFMRQPMAPKVPPPAALPVAPGPKPVAAQRDPLAPSGTPKPSVPAPASQPGAVGAQAPQPVPSTPAAPGANPTPGASSSPSQVAPAILEPRTSSAHPSATVQSPQRAEATAKPTQATAAVMPRIRTTADPDETTANPEQAVRPAVVPGKRRTRKESAAPVMSVPTLEQEISSKPAEPGPGTVAPVIKDAYLALQEGHLDRAEKLYRNALQSEGQNIDALLGLAAIAAQRGEVQQAIGFYERILDAEPRNATAQAGLIALIGQADPQMSEMRLKQLIAREPSAFLYYSLGNFHANQNQWPAAQQAYFQAFQMQSDNPDYAYNLAVGLEHLNQSKLALTYYRKAIDLSFQKGRANFDQKRVIERIGQLSARFD